MAPLSPDNTDRYKFFYSNGGTQHTAIVRTAGIGAAAVGVFFDAFLTALAGTIFSTTLDEAQFAPSGSSIFNTVVTGIEGNTYGSGTGDATDVANFVGFVGRTSGGRRSRIFVYGTDVAGSIDYRIATGESAAVDAAVGVINTASGCFLGIDGLLPVWKAYANTGVSAHWQKALRP